MGQGLTRKGNEDFCSGEATPIFLPFEGSTTFEGNA